MNIRNSGELTILQLVGLVRSRINSRLELTLKSLSDDDRAKAGIGTHDRWFCEVIGTT